ncbi:DNA ligase 1-like isoform X1 [Melia azedarach]|uniref:DNA ligase 1-like isoform X1 n=1 Tax=Melia azedarach TaxID=155640 RepID=A0ACC1WQK1_MELAZ|nr:DNA ligase 1-like isoform X1 [Melia azedarach]
MTDEAKDSETVSNDAHDKIESKIKTAMNARVSHFKEQADALTFEGVRRLLEKDLGLETHALDVHKKFIKQCLVECVEGAGAGDENASKNCEETSKESVSSTKKEEKSPEVCQSEKEVKESCPEGAEKMEDSPVLGLMTGQKTTKSKAEETQSDGNKEVPSESTIKKAIRKRATYVKANSEKVTMAGLRRLLEEDLKLDKHTLDPFKKLISQELDEVLKSSEALEPSNVDKKKSLKKNSQSKAKEGTSKGSSDTSDGEIEEEDDDVKPRKKILSKGKMQKSEGLKKRKRPEKETKASSKKTTKAAKTVSEDKTNAEDSGSVSDEGRSQSSAEKPVKMQRKEVSTPAYGKRVEHLKTVIKSCGMSVPPSIYKKVKQVPENKREAQLIKELEDILSREGLSSNPSEKEIKEVRKKKERARELEGIDMSNIVTSSRRRSTTSFIPPPKPKIPDVSESSDSEDSDDDSNSNDDEKNDEKNDADGNAESQSEEANEEDAEDTD